jgi:hypothetical protein
VISSEYEQIKNANAALTVLLKGTGLFKTVLRGFPEDINVYSGPTVTSYITGADFKDTMGVQNKPEYLNTLIGVIVKGTKTEAHDKTLEASLALLSNFREQDNWKTLEGNVRNTSITNFNIYPEKSKKGLLTTAILQLKHHIYK